MMEDYIFEEERSQNVEVDGEVLRRVDFKGTEQTTKVNENLSVSGRFTMPLMEYFQAGMEGRLPEVIRDKVIERISSADGE